MSSIKFEKILPCAVLVMLLLANTVFAQPLIDTKTYNLFNASDAQYPAYKQMKNETVGPILYNSTAVSLAAVGIQCFPSKWIAPNWTMQTWVNGTWNFSVYGYCSHGTPVAYLFAKILKYNGTEYNPYNTTQSATDICVQDVPPGVANNWAYTVPYNSILNLSTGERVGVQFCINITTSNPGRSAYIQWEGTSPSIVYFPASYSDTQPPDITFISQDPADISTNNVFDRSLNITYNITDPSGVNQSTITIFYKTNSSTSDCLSYVNGTATPCGWENKTYHSNSSDSYLFTFLDNEVYPATYNFPERSLELTNHSVYVLSQPNDMLKIRLFNVSNQKEYGLFEIMANTSNTRELQFYYCNSSYVDGTVFTSPYCTGFYILDNAVPYNHSHSNYSQHHTIPFAMNKTSGKIGDVYVTPVSYFVIRPTLIGSGSWNVYYISNVSRPDTTQTSANVGVAWANFSGTVDSHLHQYDGSDAFRYYVCANDTLGNGNCSGERYDYINLTGIPPTSPDVYSPTNTTYSGNISINYTASISPNGYNISHYNITLLNSDGTFNKTIQSNNSLNLSYLWDSTSSADGVYIIKVEGCDVLGQCSYGLSENFTVDNTKPSITLNYPPQGYLTNQTSINFNWTAYDNIDTSPTCNLTIDSSVNASNIPSPNGTATNYTVSGFSDGIHYWNVTCWDDAYNTNTSETRNFTVDTTAPTLSIQSPMNTTYNVSTINLNYTTSNGDIDTCWYSLDGGAATPLATCQNITLPVLADGYHNVTVYVNDTANNIGSAIVYFTVDTTAPTLSIQSPMNTTYNVSTINLNYTTSNGDIDTCWYYRDGAGPTPLPNCTNVTLPALADGSHYVTVYVNDTAGNEYSPVVFFTVDTTPPAVTIQSPLNTTYGTNTVNLDYTVSDNIAVDSCWYSLDGGAATPLATCQNITLPVLADGYHNVTVYVNDTANNQNSSIVYFAVDTTFPIISIQSPMNIIYNISTVDLNYTTSNGGIDTCWYYLDGAGPTALPATCQNITLPAVSDGPHNVTVYVNDTANNTAFAVAYFTVDTTPPAVAIQSPDNITYSTPNVDLNYTASDNLALNSCWYVLDGGTITPLPGCGNSSLGPLSNGQHNVTVFADDTGGNQNSSTVFFTINVPAPPSGGDGGETKMLDASWEQICPDDEIVIDVTYKSDPVADVKVRIIRYTTLANLIDIVYTDSDGQITFAPSNEGEYRFYISKSGYRYDDDPLVIDYIFCEKGCTSETDCPSDQYCDDGECKPVECDCGYLENHQCVQYECCSDGDCAEGYLCENNECILPPECENDEDCPLDEYCSNSECIPVEEEECGYVENHAWNDYRGNNVRTTRVFCPNAPKTVTVMQEKNVRMMNVFLLITE